MWINAKDVGYCSRIWDSMGKYGGLKTMVIEELLGNMKARGKSESVFLGS